MTPEVSTGLESIYRPTKTSINGMLKRALDWGAAWHDKHPLASSALDLSKSDVVVLGLIIQISEADSIICIDPDLANELPPVDWIKINAAEIKTSEKGPNLVLAAIDDHANDQVLNRANDRDRVVFYGVRETCVVAPLGFSLRALSTVNPALWATSLALVVSCDQQKTDVLLARLDAVLGDQSLDVFSLYEEVCQLREIVHPSTNQSRAEHELLALRRYVRDLIDRAAITAKRTNSRSNLDLPVDWSSAFLISNDSGASEKTPIVDEAEIRARRSRLEAEFLRDQLRMLTIGREVNHHNLIATSGFFDIAWYAKTYNIPPEKTIRHYLEFGHLEDYNPSPYFNTSAYYSAYPDVRTHGLNPLLHYLIDGIYEGRSIDPPSTIGDSIWLDGYDKFQL